MPKRAHITSTEALEFFRTALIMYLAKASRTLDEVKGSVLRTKLWLENDQRTYWQNQVRRRTEELEQARQALLKARTSKLRESTGEEEIVLREAVLALREGEAKLKLLKQWNRAYDRLVGPLEQQLDKLRNFLAYDMAKGVTYLTQAGKALDAYTEIAPAGASAAQAQPSEQNTADAISENS